MLATSVPGRNAAIWKVAAQTITSWNQIVQWLREMNMLREAAEPCVA